MGNAPLDPLRLGLVAPAIFVVLFLLFLSRWLKEYGEVERVRDALRPEAERNLEQLKEYWGRLRPRESSEDEIHSLQKRRYARELALTPLPQFSRSAYESQLPFIRRSNQGKPFNRVTDFYADLRLLENLQRELQMALAAGAAESRVAHGAPTAPGPADRDYDEFLRIAGRTWDEAWHRIERLVEQRNPLS